MPPAAGIGQRQVIEAFWDGDVRYALRQKMLPVYIALELMRGPSQGKTLRYL